MSNAIKFYRYGYWNFASDADSSLARTDPSNPALNIRHLRPYNYAGSHFRVYDEIEKLRLENKTPLFKHFPNTMLVFVPAKERRAWIQ